MNRIQSLFSGKKSPILSIYFTAGYPKLEDTVPTLQSLQKAGVDFVEIGMPFSDPVADGPTIQHSSEVALENGMTVKLLFEQLKGIRQTVQMPLLLMGYINPVLQYGIEAFCQTCEEIGIDGVILPDMPMEVYLKEYKPYFEKHGLINIFLITPQSSAERVKWIDEHSKGFVYMVSTFSTTGTKSSFGEKQTGYFQHIQSLGLKNPTVIGFGISDPTNFKIACDYANGAIVGSAFVKMQGESQQLERDIPAFVSQIRGSEQVSSIK
jgi:tryptophan synthase alpha chain